MRPAHAGGGHVQDRVTHGVLGNERTFGAAPGTIARHFFLCGAAVTPDGLATFSCGRTGTAAGCALFGFFASLFPRRPFDIPFSFGW